jgi:prepilin-type N-terminal cleavage/methylation domain-containing protein
MKLNLNKTGSHRETGENSREAGFSLLELIIAMVIFLIVTASIYGLMQVGRVDRNRSSRRSDVMKNARVAIHLIGRDALNAGFGYHRRGAVVPDNFMSSTFGVPTDADTERDMLTSVVAGNNLFTNDLQTVSTARTDIIGFAYRDIDFSSGQAMELENVSAPSGTPSTARLKTKLSTGFTSATAAKKYDLYLIESDTSQIAMMATDIPSTNQIDGALADPLGMNQALNGTGNSGSVLRKCTSSSDENCTTYLATAKKFNLVSYRVKQDGTLVRIIYGNNTGAPFDQQKQELPLAYNVEDLQFEYVLENGTVTDNPSAGPDGVIGTADDEAEDFNLIRQITVTIKVQSTEFDEQTKKPVTITLTATFSARNLEYDAG